MVSGGSCEGGGLAIYPKRSRDRSSRFELSGRLAGSFAATRQVERHRCAASREVLGLIAAKAAYAAVARRHASRAATRPARRVLAAPRARGEGIASPSWTDLAAGRPPCRRADRSAGCAGLLRALMAWSRGERQVCSMVRRPRRSTRTSVASAASEGRCSRSACGSAPVKGLCAAQGIYDYEPLGAVAASVWPARDRGRPRVAGPAAAEIGRQLDCLELVLRHLAEVEAVRDARAAQAREEGGSKLAACCG